MELKIIGFGACMISGFPFPAETGFLYHAVRHLQKHHALSVQHEVVTLGGFPVPRAQKHLHKKVLGNHPDVVVLQFGSTDASAPLRRSPVARLWTKQPDRDEKVAVHPAGFKHALKWKLWGIASDVLLVKPVTPLNEYLDAMEQMVVECLAAGSAVVALSPFVIGSGHSNRLAKSYTRALRRRLARYPKCYFLNVHELLGQWPRQQMLLSDGFHLSEQGHAVVGERLGEILQPIVFFRRQSNIKRTTLQ
jgi:lysophospholipase L1-like esterase